GILMAGILEKTGRGQVRVRLESDCPVDEAIDTVGRTPLPPYIRREPNEADRRRYQTVYAEERGSVAAPTAGLHFSGELLDAIREKGIDTATITLHVGIGTFRPLGEEDMWKKTLHSEFSVVPESAVRRIEACRNGGGRVVAVGTTTTRALETAASGGDIISYRGRTNLFIKPPYPFRVVDALVTNFHLPRSSLLMLVCAFAGRERVLAAYREAVRAKYRFYSYGDAMLILRRE
ncbi:MAG: tRNA preQ1(34) S-adenosylmethionine ribosyltransferase-isomerase QueA, partial [Candidatus Latescibacteria bacterium]|nr:tRNA preQ1(34) S-adenosylmethionine ribosyltransferase-isomerase QueA [Candidatus Latescibacterota bacterium]